MENYDDDLYEDFTVLDDTTDDYNVTFDDITDKEMTTCVFSFNEEYEAVKAEWVRQNRPEEFVYNNRVYRKCEC